MKLFKVLAGHKVANVVYAAGSFIKSHKDLLASWGPELFEFIKDLPEGGDESVPVPEASPLKELVADVAYKVKEKRAGRPKKVKVVVEPTIIEETPPEDLQGE